MIHDDSTDTPKATTKPLRRTIMPAYYKMSQDLGPLPKRFMARRIRFLSAAILAVIVLALALHFWW